MGDLGIKVNDGVGTKEIIGDNKAFNAIGFLYIKDGKVEVVSLKYLEEDKPMSRVKGVEIKWQE